MEKSLQIRFVYDNEGERLGDKLSALVLCISAPGVLWRFHHIACRNTRHFAYF